MLLLEFLALMPTQTINRSNNKMYSTPHCFICSLSQISLTIDIHVHVEGKKRAAAVAPGANRADVGPVVTGLDLWQLGHCAYGWLFFALHGNAARCCPGDVGDGKVRTDPGNQAQGAVLQNGCSGDNSDWRWRRTRGIRARLVVVKVAAHQCQEFPSKV